MGLRPGHCPVLRPGREGAPAAPLPRAAALRPILPVPPPRPQHPPRAPQPESARPFRGRVKFHGDLSLLYEENFVESDAWEVSKNVHVWAGKTDDYMVDLLDAEPAGLKAIWMVYEMDDSLVAEKD